MRSFQLIELPGTQFDKEKQPAEWEADRLDYIALVRQVMRVPASPNGVNYEEMEKALRVLRALEGKKLGDLLILEDEDYNQLCNRVRETKWMVVDERIVRFSHDVLDAKEYSIDVMPGERRDNGHAPAARMEGKPRPIRAR